MPKPNELQAKIEKGETLNLTEYWQAIADLLQHLESEIPDAERSRDETYQKASTTLKKLAELGITLEAASIFSLNSLGNKMLAAKADFQNAANIPQVTSQASYRLAKGYLNILNHLQSKKVTSSKLIQAGLDNKMPGQSKSGYQDANDSFIALEKAIKQYELQNEKTNVQAITKDLNTPQDLLAQYKELIQLKYKEAQSLSVAFETSYLKFQALSNAIHWKSFEEMKEWPTLDKIGKKSSQELHHLLKTYQDEPYFKSMLAQSQKLNDEASLKLEVANHLPKNIPPKKLYLTLEPLLGAANKKHWENRYQNTSWKNYLSSFTSKSATEQYERDYLVGLIATEMKAATQRMQEKISQLSRIKTKIEIAAITKIELLQNKDLARLKSLKKALNDKLQHLDNAELSAAIAALLEKTQIQFALIEQLTKLVSRLCDLKPKSTLLLPEKTEDFREQLARMSGQYGMKMIKGLIYKASYGEILTVLKQPEVSLDKVTLMQSALTSVCYATRPNHERSLHSLGADLKKMYGDPTIGKRFIGALMIAAGFIVSNEELSQRGWATFKSGYDALAKPLAASLGWLKKNLVEEERAAKFLTGKKLR